jgi:signal transduction histidine kinase
MKKAIGQCDPGSRLIGDWIAAAPLCDDAAELLQSLHEMLCDVLGSRRHLLVLRDEATHGLAIGLAHPGGRMIASLKSADFLPLFDLQSEKDTERAILAKLRMALCLPLRVERRPLGVLLLGPRKDSHFRPSEIKEIKKVAAQFAITFSRLRWKKKALQALDAELLGRMSRGMAHDLNNLLTPIDTLLQLADEAKGRRIDLTLLAIARRNLGGIRDCIRDALLFTQNEQPRFRKTRLDTIISRAVDSVRPSADAASVAISIATPTKISADLDAVLIQRLLSNLLLNAIDASPRGTTIRVELQAMDTGKAGDPWLRLRISDSGSGITERGLPHIFQTPPVPLRSVGTAHFGLGLAICRQIVERHAGTFRIRSDTGHGTIVEIDLPLECV